MHGQRNVNHVQNTLIFTKSMGKETSGWHDGLLEKVITREPDDLSSSPGTHVKVEGEN